MSAYRFCRTDDIGLLVDALNRCWAPHFPGEPPMTPAAIGSEPVTMQLLHQTWRSRIEPCASSSRALRWPTSSP